MGVALTKALADQPQFVRMYVMNAVARGFFFWLPQIILHVMHRKGLGRQWKIQGNKKPDADMAWRDIRSNITGEFLGNLMLAFVFRRFLTGRSFGRTLGASIGGTVGALAGGAAGSVAGTSLGNAAATAAGGTIGASTGTLVGASIGASVGALPDKICKAIKNGSLGPLDAQQKDTEKSNERMKDDEASMKLEDEGEQGWSGLRFKGPAPALQTHAWQVAVAYAIYDTMFYWSHRLMHHPRFYKHCHKIHHEYKTPIAVASSHQHVIEAIVQLFNWYVPIGVAGWLNRNHGGVHSSTVFYYYCFRWIETVDAHCGHEFPFSPFKVLPFCLGARGHDFHHRAFDGNYGAMIFWDRLCGTDSGFWEEIRDEGLLMGGVRVPYK